MAREEHVDLEQLRRERIEQERSRVAAGQARAALASQRAGLAWHLAENWLKAGLQHNPLSPATAVLPVETVPFSPGGLGEPLPAPQRPSLFARLRGRDESYREAVARYREQESARVAALSAAEVAHEEAQRAALASLSARNESLEALHGSYLDGDGKAVGAWLRACMECEPAYNDHLRSVDVAYVENSRHLIVEADAPRLDDLPEAPSFRYVKATNEIAPPAKAQAQRRTLYGSLLAQTALRTLHALFMDDTAARVDTISLSLYVQGVDRSTGRRVRPCVLSVRVSRSAFAELHLDEVDPVACLRTLNAAVSRSPDELFPVPPVASIDLTDRRFVSEEEILSSLDTRPNLLELTPSEFESLITNLFSRMGLETRLTQASRDGGVDCVAFDMRPVIGGKVVIQAKRYSDTVGVSAVRDLYGTMLNEGAGKGILVTTSGYGPAAFEFAANKPIELLSGANLLALLSEWGGVEAKIQPVEAHLRA